MTAGKPIQSEIWHYPGAREAFFTKTAYSHHHFQPHFHTHYVFFCVARGVNEGSFYKKKYIVAPGDFLVIQPGEVHSGNSFSNRPLLYYSFCPSENFLQSAAENMELKSLPGFSPVIANAGIIVEKFYSLVNSSCKAGILAAEQVLTDFLGTLTDKSCKMQLFKGSKNSCRENIDKARRFIEDNYANDFSLKELSAHAGLSTWHLLRSFKAAMGLTPYSYLNNFRVEMAKQKIGKKSSLTSLAHSSGFYDQSHFIRHFKKINGIAPSKFKH